MTDEPEFDPAEWASELSGSHDVRIWRAGVLVYKGRLFDPGEDGERG